MYIVNTDVTWPLLILWWWLGGGGVGIYVFDQIKTFSHDLSIVLQGWHPEQEKKVKINGVSQISYT